MQWCTHAKTDLCCAVEFISVIEASKSAVFSLNLRLIVLIVTTFTNVEALSLQAWTCMLTSILS